MPRQISGRFYLSSLPMRRLFLLPLLLLLFVATPASLLAHPLGNFSVNRYSLLEVGVEQIDLLYILDIAEIPAFQERGQMDTNGDEQVSAEEQERYLTRQLAILQNNLHLTVNGTAVPLTLSEQTLAFEEGQGGLQTLRLTLRLVATLPAAQAEGQVEYRDENYQDRLGWQEIVVRPASGVSLLDASVPSEDLTQQLRAYPDDLLQSPLVVNRATFRFQPGEASSAASPTGALVPAGAPREDEFASLIELPDVG
ncbi:MAG: hypothetical protein H0T73_11380, partial [Ardenticatenales bacterium]|nr:hypothetical protein [Ardenticatenales bacterium]